MTLRIAVMNLQSGIGVTKGYRQYVTRGWRYVLPHPGLPIEDAGQFLKSEKADIALLTEIEGGSRRSRYSSQITTVSEHAGLPHAHFFPTRRVGSAINEGSAIASRFPISSTKLHPLQRAANPRVLGETVIDHNGTDITVLVGHLALRSGPRAVQLKELARILERIEGPVILGGDFNERDHAAFSQLAEIGLTHVCLPNYPSWNPRHALQVLFLSEHFEVQSMGVPKTGTRFSDHLPLVVEARLQATMLSSKEAARPAAR